MTRLNPNLSDMQLVALAKTGVPDALGMLYSRYFPLVFNRCLSFFRDSQEAADCAQDIMMKVFDHIKKFKGESKFSTWLFAVTFNHCTDQLRKLAKRHARAISFDVENVESTDTFPGEDRHSGYQYLNVDQLLSPLSLQEKELLISKYQENRSIRELQVKYKMSASAIKMRLLRARTKAQNALSTVSVTVPEFL